MSIDTIPFVNEREFFLPNPLIGDGKGSTGLKGQAADSEFLASEQALWPCPALR
jgi:hypothetical protein